MFSSTFRNLFACALLALANSPIQVSAADVGAPVDPPGNYDEWTGWGGNVYNNRWNSKNTRINSTTVPQLVQNCKIDYAVGVAATPVIKGYIAYYPTANGSFYALNIATCQYVWSIDVTKLISDFATPTPFMLQYSKAIARTSPQIDGNTIYFGTQVHALLVAADVRTGQILDKVQVNNHPLAIVTISPTVYDGKVFIGASSHEDGAAADTNYKCCNFIGNFAAYTLDAKSRKFTKNWEVKTLPENQGWAGAGVWGSQPSIDPVRKQIFIGTGNLLIYPEAFKKCANESHTCLPDGVWQDSIVAIDYASGKVNWRQTITPLDVWNMACGYAGAPTSESSLCPGAPGPDSDFGMAPTFVPAALGDGTTGNDSVVVGQKSGNIYSLNAKTGETQWLIAVGADNSGSWLSWGIAVDAARIYFTAINYGLKEYVLKPSGQTIKNSGWGTVDLKTGKPVWQVQVPNAQLAYSPPGLVNDVVFVGSSGSATANVSGSVVALNKQTGALLHSLPGVEGVQNSGIVAKGGFVLFGTGYAYRNPFNTGSFYVYALPGAIADAIAEIAKDSEKASKTSTSSGTAAQASSSSTQRSGASQRDGAGILIAIYPLVALFAIYSTLV